MKKAHNFSAGPAILPAEVIKEAAEGVLNFNNLDLSILEISHRSKDFIDVMEEARSLIKELMGFGPEYQVLFLGGGASLQFAMVPCNFLIKDKPAAYVNTGVWASKAIKEAKGLGDVKVIASSEDKKFSYVPKNYTIPADASYLHLTSNNTIYGTQMHSFPDSPVPVVCDMSSDIFSRKVDFSKFSLIYAGAQKNMGAAGATMVVIREDLLGKTGRNMFSMLDYKVHIKGESMYNTPPVFSVYVSLLTMKWLKKNGGLAWIEKINKAKADAMYGEIDRNSLFTGTCAKEDRSWMNACFLCTKPELEETFNKMWKDAGIYGIKGHRDVGGYRASLYNALPLESVNVLIDVMKEFEKKNA
ncbi:MAG TPA: 3-phosphoserine/phosphohydroxythreonine transaminase [Bacteroidia bacterium]|jgi:phosphoserine aminotransferase|nr:3-phosphoserine/phosphohydroxythreonine transaminase [Bacteroidia bacterium]